MSESCYHCGDDVIGKGYSLGDKKFCCNGCKSVYQLLHENGLNSFYAMEEQAGVKPKSSDIHRYDFLDLPAIRERYIDFEDENSVHVKLFLPAIHCSSCIYLLENIHKIEPRILSCQTNFTERTATIAFKKSFPFPELALLLDRIGYPPNFEEKKEVNKSIDKTFLYQMGVAGFAFGSIMLWSFPEYLGIDEAPAGFRSLTAYLSFFVSIPVLLYSARDYYMSAFKAIRYKQINIDVPITLGILALYAQSCYHIFSGLGPGYMDSFAGFIFFLLIGKWFQRKTYRSLSFDRDYASYFPVKKGQLVYAGGRLIGAKTRFQAKSKSERSRLANLWNKSSNVSEERTISQKKWDKLSAYFLVGVIIVASIAAISWAFIDTNRIVSTVVSVLIVACPCALALSRPFTYGNTMRKMGRSGLYLQNTEVIEDINEVTDIVFDKTGTLTKGSQEKVTFEGGMLTDQEWGSVLILSNSSTHVLSRTIAKWIKNKNLSIDSNVEVENYNESVGQGIEGQVSDQHIKIGSAKFMGLDAQDGTFISINGEVRGKFMFASELRDGLESMMADLTSNYTVHVLSGDSEKDAQMMREAFPSLENCLFKQSPEDKFAYTQQLQEQGKHVMMIGDGLNDSGALAKADVGIAISEDVFQFSPNSNGILEANKLHKLTSILVTSNFAKTVLRICLAFSIFYNIVGLGFAITGNLTPLVAAVLMPISSISIVIISTVFIHFRK
ncbi:MAG: hypothetical protein CSA03_01230 [Bacteroidetes bacterium]|nr:MAG: hypothetical protein CSA03_01230 [Bacteroidota bacterium]